MYGIPEDLTGKRVLDVGAWDGYWSFEALRRGNNQTNYWTPTLHCLGYKLTSAGFPTVKAWKLDKYPQELPRCRGFAVGTR